MLLLIFLVTPFIELYLLIKFALWFGFLSLVIQICLTAAIGFMVLQIAQSSLIYNIKHLVLRKSMPAQQMADDLLLSLGAGFLILPGIISDILGAALLIPYIRKLCVSFIQQKFKPAQNANIIEGEFYEIPNERLP